MIKEQKGMPFLEMTLISIVLWYMGWEISPRIQEIKEETGLSSSFQVSFHLDFGLSLPVILTALLELWSHPCSWPQGKDSLLGQYPLFISSYSGVQFIMGMLSEKPRSGTPAEVAACERVQQKAAVTLARLSRDPEVAREAVRLSCE